MNVAATTFIFVLIAHEINKITNKLLPLLVPSNKMGLSRNIICAVVFVIIFKQFSASKLAVFWSLSNKRVLSSLHIIIFNSFVSFSYFGVCSDKKPLSWYVIVFKEEKRCSFLFGKRLDILTKQKAICYSFITCAACWRKL